MPSSLRTAESVEALCCLRGVKTLTAMTLLSEIGDIERFPSPRALMAYFGLVPTERSSGETREKGTDHQGGQLARQTDPRRSRLEQPAQSRSGSYHEQAQAGTACRSCSNRDEGAAPPLEAVLPSRSEKTQKQGSGRSGKRTLRIYLGDDESSAPYAGRCLERSNERRALDRRILVFGMRYEPNALTRGASERQLQTNKVKCG